MSASAGRLVELVFSTNGRERREKLAPSLNEKVKNGKMEADFLRIDKIDFLREVF